MAAAPAPNGVDVLMELIENARGTLRDGDFKAAYEALALIQRHTPEPAAIAEEDARRIAIAEEAARRAAFVAERDAKRLSEAFDTLLAVLRRGKSAARAAADARAIDRRAR